MPRRITLLLYVLFSIFAAYDIVQASPTDPEESSGPLTDFSEHVDFSFRSLVYWQEQKPINSVLNADNRLELNRHLLEIDLRPDLRLENSFLQVLFKPRLELRYRSWEEGFKNRHRDEEADLFVHEWKIRLQPHQGLFLAYGREDLQWGPSFMLSPSNPFFTDNGKNRPKQESRAADYASLTWAPVQAWSLSLIANLDEGRKEPITRFQRTNAAKLDLLTEQGYFSLIVSKQEGEELRAGLFGSWNWNDASILYTELTTTDSRSGVLVGGSYTFANGGMVNLEYFYNGEGSPRESLPLLLLNSTSRETFFVRRHYALLQYAYEPVFSDWNLMLRMTHGFDDQSSMILAHSEYDLGNHLRLYLSTLFLKGDKDAEFSSLLDYQANLGIEYIF